MDFGIQLFINGEWVDAEGGEALDILNPATGETIGKVAKASARDIDRAVDAAVKGFEIWRSTSAFDRNVVMMRAAQILRERADQVAKIITLEQGKLFRDAKGEVARTVEVIEWLAGEAPRAYGRIIPSRSTKVRQLVVKEPIGPVAAFTPWNFPISQAIKKIAAALAAGCSVVIKPPEDTPASVAELVKVFADAGLPGGVLNMICGIPAEISGRLIPHPAIRKISFTGSVPVGKQLAALAGTYMKPATMELGGHAPVIVCNDADVDSAAKTLFAAKIRNAGQVCVSPTRFLVQDGVYDEFVGLFIEKMKSVQVADGMDPKSEMGPVISRRRLEAIEDLIGEAQQKGAKLETGGNRVGNTGYFLQPTVLTGVTKDMRAMNEEPFGPIALVTHFKELDDAIEEANRLPYGLAAYAFTRNSTNTRRLDDRLETGMLTTNHIGLALPETPFGGVRDSGYGSEGGSEAIEAYLRTKFLTEMQN